MDDLARVKTDLLHKKDLFVDLDNYKSEMTISQAVKYFSRHDANSFTKTMIQNYIRVGVLPQPRDKRWYAKKQLCALAIIDSLKFNFALDEIGALFKLLELYEADGDDWYVFYKEVLSEYNNALDEYPNPEEADIISLMAKSAAYKALALAALRNGGIEQNIDK